MLRITSYAIVSKAWNADLYSGKVTVDEMVDYAITKKLGVGFRVNKDGLIIKKKRILTLDDIEFIAERGVMVYVESDYDLLKGRPNDPEDPILFLAKFSCKLREKYKGDLKISALRVTVAHKLAKKERLGDSDYRSIAKKAKAYDKALAEFGGALAMENTYHTSWEMGKILRYTEGMERIGWAIDPGNFTTKELQQKCVIMPEQGDILSLAKQYIEKVFLVHLKQIKDGKPLAVVLEYPAGKFMLKEMIKDLKSWGYEGVFGFEPVAEPGVIENMNASLESIVR